MPDVITLSDSEIFVYPELPMAAYRELIIRPTYRVSGAGVRLIFVLSGGARVWHEGGHIDVAPGHVLTLQEGAWLRGAPRGYVAAVSLYFRSEFLESQVRWIPHSHPLRHDIEAAILSDRRLGVVDVGAEAMALLTPKLNTLTALRHHPARLLECAARVAEIFDDVGGMARSTAAGLAESRPWPVRGRDEIAQAIGLVRSAPQRHWSVLELSREVSLSVSQFSRLFRREMGVSPGAFLWLLRVELLAETLATRDITITKAAHEGGWASAAAASRAFKRRYGVSPLQFAKDIRTIRLHPQREISNQDQSVPEGDLPSSGPSASST